MAVNEENIPLEREVRIDAPADVIFKFFVDPAHIVRWMGIHADLDARPGGIFRVNVTGQDVARGEYVEVSPNERVVFTWGWEGEGNPVRPGCSTVEVRLEPDGPATLVRLRHLGLPGGPGDRHAEGWDHYLGRLAVAVAGGDAGADPWIRPTPPGSTEET
ncbi:MAG TPA: SRPBCC family protein [Acidimicrobiia bacterium]|nr:SRPBCC family protein [Acidimicrobiia bacterium]